MTIEEFAEKHRIRIRLDSCGDKIIPGRLTAKDMPKRMEYRSHIYDNGGGRLGVCLMFATARRSSNPKKILTAQGFTFGQVGDSELTALFDPDNEAQSKAALAVCRIKRIRILSEAQRLALQKINPSRNREFKA